MEHIKGVLNKRIRQSGLASQVNTSLIFKEFESIIGKNFGPEFKTKIRPLYLKNKILTAACLSSVMAAEFRFRKNEILRQINNKFGQEAVKDIKLII